MASTTTPTQRVQRLIGEGARLMALCPGQTSIDVTPDILALLDGFKPAGQEGETARNLLEPRIHGRDLATGVHFPCNAPNGFPT
jgi:hypothetical protein